MPVRRRGVAMGFRANTAITLTIALLAASPAAAHALLSKQVPDAVASHSVAVAGTPDAKLHLTLQVVLPMRNRAELKEFTRAVSDPASPQFRHYLSVAEFTKRFG